MKWSSIIYTVIRGVGPIFILRTNITSIAFCFLGSIVGCSKKIIVSTQINRYPIKQVRIALPLLTYIPAADQIIKTKPQNIQSMLL